MDAVKTILAVIGAYTVACLTLSAVTYFRDRSGNSGKYRHWSEEE